MQTKITTTTLKIYKEWIKIRLKTLSETFQKEDKNVSDKGNNPIKNQNTHAFFCFVKFCDKKRNTFAYKSPIILFLSFFFSNRQKIIGGRVNFEWRYNNFVGLRGSFVSGTWISIKIIVTSGANIKNYSTH